MPKLNFIIIQTMVLLALRYILLKTNSAQNRVKIVLLNLWFELYVFIDRIKMYKRTATIEYQQYTTHPAEINIASDLHSIGTIRVRGWSIHTNYLDNYVKVLHKKFYSKFCLFVYLLTKMCAISRNFGPRKFLKIFFHFFIFTLAFK